MSVQQDTYVSARPGPPWVALSEAAAAIVRALVPHQAECHPSRAGDLGEDH